MKKSIVALSIALLVVSLGASLALAAPVAPSAPQGMMTWPTGEDSTPPMMGQGVGQRVNLEQMQTQMQSQQNNGMLSASSKDMPCQPNSATSK